MLGTQNLWGLSLRCLPSPAAGTLQRFAGLPDVVKTRKKSSASLRDFVGHTTVRLGSKRKGLAPCSVLVAGQFAGLRAAGNGYGFALPTNSVVAVAYLSVRTERIRR
jgi:hypothetical protein